MGLLETRPSQWLPIDDLDEARICIDLMHHEIHEANNYTVSYSKAISAGSVLAVAITTPTSHRMHLIGGLQSSLSGTFIFSQGASISSGSALTIWNNDLSSTNTSGSVIVGTPVVTTYGTVISTYIIGTNDKQNGIGGSGESRNEFILATSSTYILYFTANATSTFSSINISYYMEE
jgi:hypothetical protein